jgi:cytochrome oxidase Cu insertion factor (SCO1/SenC/PrrC family)
LSRRFAIAAVVLAAIGGVVIGVVVHRLSAGGSDAKGSTEARVRGQAVWPAGLRQAPEFALREAGGSRFALGSLRGRPLILAFMDSQCHQQCPLEGRTLAAGFRMVPPAERPVVVAVSVNPWEDTPASAHAAIERFGLAPFETRWLLGSKAELAPVWHRYGIEVRRATGDIEHTDAIYLIDSQGWERAGIVYPFLPTWIGDDLKTLAAEA